MFRYRLVAVILVSFSFVLFLGLVLYRSSNQVSLYLQRSQSAYQTFDNYQQLSQEAYRYFKQRMDQLITNNTDARAGVDASRLRLYEAMEQLRDSAVNTPANISKQDEWFNTPAELARVAQLTAFLDASVYRFHDIEQLRKQDKRELAIRALSKYTETEIDGKFQGMIDTAISAEREKAKKAKIELESLVNQQRWTALLAALFATVFSLTSLSLLLRSIKKPIEALMKGTEEIANGHLNYRIPILTRDEFAYLATHFNTMAEKLGLQQAKLREGRSVLEARVEERTSELRRLNTELQRMDSERRQFLADISHELRTPITIIRGEAEVTLRGKDRETDEYKDALQRIVELAMQLGKYVNDLLFLARAATSANLQFEWDDLDLTELITVTVEDFQVMAQENAISVSLAAPGKKVLVRGDRQRIRQVLYILGDNACRYSKPEGHIAVRLWVENLQVHLSLQDQGIGIPADDLAHIFDRHFRSKNAYYSFEAGSGLGLPLAKSIICAHGGVIAVSSTENSGSTFTITLPLLVAKEPLSNES